MDELFEDSLQPSRDARPDCSFLPGLGPGHFLFALVNGVCRTPAQSERGKSLDSDYRTYGATRRIVRVNLSSEHTTSPGALCMWLF
ncbi:hypothetical protein Y032_0035g3127 [Ancylostoma ceylanicum]|uniref:Uncharacterized protein n=1 Tax=Ancylostoma ceylanicum TaxID=53326 RepID=A0A016UL21_9BILA|nr:hypothetical protein Y032_0035g3127 [Ancylostoma ceylanicum]